MSDTGRVYDKVSAVSIDLESGRFLSDLAQCSQFEDLSAYHGRDR